MVAFTALIPVVRIVTLRVFALEIAESLPETLFETYPLRSLVARWHLVSGFGVLNAYSTDHGIGYRNYAWNIHQFLLGHLNQFGMLQIYPYQSLVYHLGKSAFIGIIKGLQRKQTVLFGIILKLRRNCIRYSRPVQNKRHE